MKSFTCIEVEKELTKGFYIKKTFKNGKEILTANKEGIKKVMLQVDNKFYLFDLPIDHEDDNDFTLNYNGLLSTKESISLKSIVRDCLSFNFWASAARDLIGDAKNIYTILQHCSASGTSRSISVVVGKNNDVRKLDFYIHKVSGYYFDPKNGGLKVSSSGMDIGFNLVYNFFNDIYGKWDQMTIRHNWL